MKTKDILFVLISCVILSACGSGSDSDPTPLADGPDGPTNSCSTNVAGCEAAQFSCSAAEFCYTTSEGCIQSLECATGNPPVTPPMTSQPVVVPGSSCTTNVTGCEAAQFSCNAAEFCYATAEDCVQSNECPIQ